MKHSPSAPPPAPPSAPSPAAAAAPEPAAPSPARLAELRRAAVDYIQRAIGCSVEIREESLAFVDHYLQHVRQGGALHQDVLRLVAAAIGVHLGEVMIARFGGRWVALPATANGTAAADDPAQWRVEIAAAPLVCDPIAMAQAALAPPDGDDPAGFTTRPALREPLRTALARIPPVSVDYYYSLTGRFETLVYVVELLAELQRQQQAPV